MKQSKYLIRFSLALSLSISCLSAAVQPNSLFSDGAVLQQGIPIPVWGKANEGEKVTVQLNAQTATTVAKDGKWMVRLTPQSAGGPYTLSISGENTVTVKNVMVGEVWICSGQSNMAFNMRRDFNAAEEIPKATYPKLRMFTVGQKTAIAPETLAKGTWTECSPQAAPNFSAVGYYFGREIHKATGVAVGMIHSSVGGTPAQAWTSLSGLEAEPELADYAAKIRKLIADYPKANETYLKALEVYNLDLKTWNESPEAIAYEDVLKTWWAQNKEAAMADKPTLSPRPVEPTGKPKQPLLPTGGQNSPTVLYNGMIAPLIPYAIKGVIWYQGESNVSKPAEYSILFPRLIQDWREQWGQGSFPFLFVQITPHNGMTPELREAQLLSWQKTPQTAMAVTTDLGDAKDIHPRKKEPVGARLSLAARALAYGEKIEYSGPVFDSMKVEGNQARLSFHHTGGGLVAQGGELMGFTIAGADQKFVPAKAQIQGRQVLVSSPEVAHPEAVRYGWCKVPDVNLVNAEGLPATPFRTR